MDASKSTIVLDAAGVLISNEGDLSKGLRLEGLVVSFEFAYAVVVDEVLELRFVSPWMFVLSAKILVFLKSLTRTINYGLIINCLAACSSRN